MGNNPVLCNLKAFQNACMLWEAHLISSRNDYTTFQSKVNIKSTNKRFDLQPSIRGRGQFRGNRNNGGYRGRRGRGRGTHFGAKQAKYSANAINQSSRQYQRRRGGYNGRGRGRGGRGRGRAKTRNGCGFRGSGSGSFDRSAGGSRGPPNQHTVRRNAKGQVQTRHPLYRNRPDSDFHKSGWIKDTIVSNATLEELFSLFKCTFVLANGQTCNEGGHSYLLHQQLKRLRPNDIPKLAQMYNQRINNGNSNINSSINITSQTQQQSFDVAALSKNLQKAHQRISKLTKRLTKKDRAKSNVNATQASLLSTINQQPGEVQNESQTSKQGTTYVNQRSRGAGSSTRDF